MEGQPMVYIILTILLMAFYFYNKLKDSKEISWSSIGCWCFISFLTTIMLIGISVPNAPIPPQYKAGGYCCSCFILLVSSSLVFKN